MPLETARLLLRPPRLTDAAALFDFLGDTTAMRYTTPRTSVPDCRRYLAAHQRQRQRVGCAVARPYLPVAFRHAAKSTSVCSSVAG